MLGSRRVRLPKMRRVLLGAGLVASIALLASACGGPATPGVASLSGSTGSHSPGTHGTGTSGTGTSGAGKSGSGTSGTGTSGSGTSGGGSTHHNGLALAKCMRKHGVKNFPERNGTGTIQVQGNLDPNSPVFKAAQQACQAYFPHPSPAQLHKMEAQALEYSECMRKHGVTDFPDPQFSTAGGGMAVRISGAKGSLDPSSPTFQAAQKACQKYIGKVAKKAGPAG